MRLRSVGCSDAPPIPGLTRLTRTFGLGEESEGDGLSEVCPCLTTTEGPPRFPRPKGREPLDLKSSSDDGGLAEVTCSEDVPPEQVGSTKKGVPRVVATLTQVEDFDL